LSGGGQSCEGRGVGGDGEECQKCGDGGRFIDTRSLTFDVLYTRGEGDGGTIEVESGVTGESWWWW